MTNKDEPPFIGVWSVDDPQGVVQFFVPKPHFKWVPFRLSARNALIIYKQEYARMAFQYRTWLANRTMQAKGELANMLNTLPMEARAENERIIRRLKATDDYEAIQALRSQFLRELDPETLLQIGQQVTRSMEVAA